MEQLIQAALDLIMDGSLGTVSDRKAPMALRAAAAVILAAAFCALAWFCVRLIIRDKDWLVKAVGALILLLTLYTVYRFFRTIRQRRDKSGT